jgi:hypothetical protein
MIFLDPGGLVNDTGSECLQEETAMHTVEIAGRPTLVVNGSKDEVQDLLADGWLLEDLLVLETQGRPLWFGQQKDFSIRPASEGEFSQWEEAFSGALLEGYVTEWDRNGYIVYLVPVSDPTGNDEDESLDEP